jgi:hypothetical protein
MTRKRRTAHFRVRLKTFLIIAAVGVLLCGNALGTCSIKTGTTKTCGNVTPSWGGPGTYYSWQVSPGIVTNLLTSEMGITPLRPVQRKYQSKSHKRAGRQCTRCTEM